MDFMQDGLVDGRRFRTLNILDLVTRECLALEIDASLPGQRVTRVLDQLVASYGAPKQITVDNGPEVAGQLLDAWTPGRLRRASSWISSSPASPPKTPLSRASTARAVTRV
jgi:transposase InsO family protein